MEFVTTQTLQCLESMVRSSPTSVLAAPFWGTGAIEALSLDITFRKRVQIICNLLSGACNPHVIRDLIEAGYDVRSHNKLHAKVFWTPEKMLIGSSNVSASGLGFEGKEVVANIEASVIIDDKMIINQCRQWLDDVIRGSFIPDKNDIKRAIRIWKYLRNNRPVVAELEETLWDLIMSNHESFRDRRIAVWIYDPSNFSKKALDALEKIKFDRNEKNIDIYEGTDFLGSKPEAGDRVIDFHCDGKKVRKGSAWRFLGERIPLGRSNWIDLCVREANLMDRSFSAAEPDFRSFIQGHLLAAKDAEMTLFEFANRVRVASDGGHLPAER